jgi:hypothetical protein
MLDFCKVSMKISHISYFVPLRYFTHQLGDIDLIVDRRTNEVSKFLEMLRSASGNDEAVIMQSETTNKDWKVIFFLIGSYLWTFVI